MPAFDYKCEKCGWSGEILQVRFTQRNSQWCPECGYRLTRVFQKAPAAGKPGYQMRGVVYDGERKVGHVDGHFGKDAKRKRRE